jgi:hypothetical protein
MKRRTLSLAGGFAAALPILGVLGCDDRKRVMQRTLPAIPDFSAARLQARLEELRQSYETKGFNVSETLQPGLSADETSAQCSWFPESIPQEIIALYGWRGGQVESSAKKDFPFWFRDCAFLTPTAAKLEYKSMMSTYGANPTDTPLLRICFPFAAYNGGWLVIPCAAQSLEPRLQRPVISIMQGVDVHYYSIEIMLATVLEWVRHPKYDGYGLPSDVELEIWRHHNPGIFPGAA